MALGQGSLTVGEQANSYSAFVNGGTSVTPHVISGITRNGVQIPVKVLRVQVLTPNQAGQVDYALSFDTKYGTATNAAMSDGRPIIGKTGTRKSTPIERMATQDLEHGRGFALIDPHGDLVERVAQRVKAQRANNPRSPRLRHPDPLRRGERYRSDSSLEGVKIGRRSGVKFGRRLTIIAASPASTRRRE